MTVSIFALASYVWPESNILRILFVLGLSSAAYFLVARFSVILIVLSVVVFLAIVFSALFDVGEVYSYSDYYKRAFWYFGDDLTTWIVALFFLAIFARQHTLSVCLASAALLSGGRIGLLLLIIQAISVIYIFKGHAFPVARSILFALGSSLVVYFVVVASSPHAMKAANTLVVHLNLQERWGQFEATRRGYSDCRTANCFESKFKRPFRMRSLSAVAGLWMTFDGGFPGSRYPNSPEKFADLMVEANPWNINERYKVVRDEWLQIGTVQSPYLGFGAGYGPILLSLAMGFIGAVCLVGLWVLKVRTPDPFSALTIFFIVNAVFNQTQPWLLPGPVLFAMGLCGTHILWQYFTLDTKATYHEPLPVGARGVNEAQTVPDPIP